MKHFARPAALLALLTQCHKDPTPAPPTPEEQLPPATQTGAHTFGCLLNGQPWTPSSSIGSNNYKLTYDPSYHSGSLQIKVYYYLSNGGAFQAITLGREGISTTGSFPLSVANSLFYDDTSKNTPCNEYGNARTTYQSGTLVITRLDQAAGIVSGTFAFKLWQPGCDTVKVSKGRFDYKL